ncbi:hypothetical protein [Actinospica robiniae]|uniref:hypothetical protein n=1 Tax=Actinospica robiniae TaxID=304901 RepID=UPI0012FB5D64|nr:hypothetical protein [Actinospica robiniae]
MSSITRANENQAGQLAPTAKAGIKVDVASLGSITASAELTEDRAHILTATAIEIVGVASASLLPLATLYAARGVLTATECLVIIGAQFALVLMLTVRASARLQQRRFTGKRGPSAQSRPASHGGPEM